MLARFETLLYLPIAAICFGICGCTSVAPPAAPSAIPTSATAGDTTIVAIAPPGKQSCSVFDVLGVEQAVQGVAATKHHIRDHIASKLGMRFPFLEPTPELLLITDPENLSEDAPPTAKVAAEVKMKEDQAQQKIKGIRYLATIGCGGCYPGVEDAFIAGLEDCTEAVRYESALAIRKTVGRECSFCSGKACCSEKIQTKLLEMTTLDGCDCYSEPSARVRRQARLALRSCGPEIRVSEEDLDEDVGDDAEELPGTPPKSGDEDLTDDDLKDEEGASADDSDESVEDEDGSEEEADEPGSDELALAEPFQLSPLNQMFRPW